jgi:hypothetical protein
MVPPTGREVPAIATIDVDHDAYLGRACGSGFAITSRTGELTVLDGRLRTVRRRDLGGPLADLTISGDRWAWVVGGELRIGDAGGGGDPTPLTGAPACRWTPSGQALWVANGAGGQVEVELRTPDGQVSRAVTVPDTFGDSFVRLRHHPHADAVVLWLSAGQDGQQSWLVRDDGTALTATHLPADDCIPAVFGPAGDWLLTADEHRLAMLSWPAGATMRALAWADIDSTAAADGTDTPSDCLTVLPGGFASWNTANGRLRTIDLTTMTVVDEFTIAGHPVRTAADLDPDRAGDDTPAGDFSHSVPHGDGLVLSIHGRDTVVLTALRDWSPNPDRH